MMNAAALQEDPKEVFKTYSQVLNALCVSYHARYPLQPLETLTMVLLDIGRYMAGISPPVLEEEQKDLTLCSIFQIMGEDLAVRIGAHSMYQEAMARACAGCMSNG